MIKIDRVLQKVRYIGEGEIKNKIITNDYILSPETENKVLTLKTNIGKTLNNGLNDGATIEDFNLCNKNILEGLNLELLNNKTIEFCIDIPTDSKMIDNKIFAVSFHNALSKFNCKRVTNTFKAEKDISREKQSIIGVKGFLKGNHTSIKLYSKQEEREKEGYLQDIIRFEIILDTYSLERLGLDIKISDNGLDPLITFIKTFLNTWRAALGKKNRYSKKVFELIDFVENEV